MVSSHCPRNLQANRIPITFVTASRLNFSLARVVTSLNGGGCAQKPQLHLTVPSIIVFRRSHSWQLSLVSVRGECASHHISLFILPWWSSLVIAGDDYIVYNWCSASCGPNTKGCPIRYAPLACRFPITQVPPWTCSIRSSLLQGAPGSYVSLSISTFGGSHLRTRVHRPVLDAD